MVQTIFDVLTQPDPEFISQYDYGGPNSTNRAWIPMTEWRPWRDFTFETLKAIFGDVLSTSWNKPPIIDEGSVMDYVIKSEKKLDLMIGKFQWPIVNGALARACKAFKMAELFYLKEGSSCHVDGPPDWGLVSDRRMFGQKYWNILPGDTKLFGKWDSGMEQSSDLGVRHQWSLPVSQITTYLADAECRYRFIVTEREFVALRLTKESIGPGLAASRPERSASQAYHQRVASGNTDISSLMDGVSLDSFGGQSYSDNNPRDMEYLPLEFAVVPPVIKGSGHFTIKLALFCLCLMAARGETSIDFGYPPLDSWRWNNQDRQFFHITSGFTAKRLPKGALEIPSHGNASDAPQEEEQQQEPAPASGLSQSGANIFQPQNLPSPEIPCISAQDAEMIISDDKNILKDNQHYRVYHMESNPKKVIHIPIVEGLTKAIIQDGQDFFDGYIWVGSSKTIYYTWSLPEKGKAVKRRK